MTVQAYRPQPFEKTHENQVFDALLERLEQAWGNSTECVVLLGNFYCQGREIDAAVIRKNSITVIDFKNYSGQIRFSENGSWQTNDGASIRGGSDINPFIQV